MPDTQRKLQADALFLFFFNNLSVPFAYAADNGFFAPLYGV